MRQPERSRDQDAVLGKHPPSFSGVRDPDDALIDIEDDLALGEHLDVLSGGHLPHQQVEMRVKVLTDDTKDPVSHPQLLSEVFSEKCVAEGDSMIDF